MRTLTILIGVAAMTGIALEAATPASRTAPKTMPAATMPRTIVEFDKAIAEANATATPARKFADRYVYLLSSHQVVYSATAPANNQWDGNGLPTYRSIREAQADALRINNASANAGDRLTFLQSSRMALAGTQPSK